MGRLQIISWWSSTIWTRKIYYVLGIFTFFFIIKIYDRSIANYNGGVGTWEIRHGYNRCIKIQVGSRYTMLHNIKIELLSYENTKMGQISDFNKNLIFRIVRAFSVLTIIKTKIF